MHINFLCLIILGSIWRFKITRWQLAAAHPEAMRAYQAKYASKETSREKAKRKASAYRKAHIEELRRKNREYARLPERKAKSREWYEANRKVCLLRAAEWKRNNRERYLAHSVRWAQRIRRDLTDGYVRECMLKKSQDLRDTVIPQEVLELRKEQIRAKRFVKECRQKLGLQPRRGKVQA